MNVCEYESNLMQLNASLVLWNVFGSSLLFRWIILNFLEVGVDDDKQGIRVGRSCLVKQRKIKYSWGTLSSSLKTPNKMSRHMEAEKPLVAARQHGLKCLDMWLTTGLMTITNIFQHFWYKARSTKNCEIWSGYTIHVRAWSDFLSFEKKEKKESMSKLIHKLQSSAAFVHMM